MDDDIYMMIYIAWFETLWDNRHDTIFTKIWHREFRVTPTTFEFIVDLVRGPLESTTQTSDSQSVFKKEQQLLFGDYLLGTLTEP